MRFTTSGIVWIQATGPHEALGGYISPPLKTYAFESAERARSRLCPNCAPGESVSRGCILDASRQRAYTAPNHETADYWSREMAKTMVVRALKKNLGEFVTPTAVDGSRSAKEMALRDHKDFAGLSVNDLYARKVSDDGRPRVKKMAVIAADNQRSRVSAPVIEDITQEVARLPGKLSGMQQTKFRGEYRGQQVIVKPSKEDQVAMQVALDNLKPICGIERMVCRQVVYNRKPALLLNETVNNGPLNKNLHVLDDDAVMDNLIGILVYDQVAGPGDRSIGNILVLPGNKKLLAIDEMRGFRYSPEERKLRFAIRKKIVDWVVKNGYEKWANIILRVMREDIKTALGERFGHKVDEVYERTRRINQLCQEVFMSDANVKPQPKTLVEPKAEAMPLRGPDSEKEISEFDLVINVLTKSDALNEPFGDEDSYEAAVWDVLRNGLRSLWPQWSADANLLTSHKKRKERSIVHWERFHRANGEAQGPDIRALKSNNRVDIVIRTPSRAMIGIEIECLGPSNHTRHLVTGLGQAALTLAAREWGLLVIHCATVDSSIRNELRHVAERIGKNSRLRIVVTPNP